MKRKVKYLILTSILLLSLLTACKPSYPPDGVEVGETCDIYDEYGEILCIVTYNSCSRETIKEEEEVLVIYNITIRPQKAIKAESKDFLLEVGFDDCYTDEGKRKTSVSDNIRINGYDIFEIELSEETNYTFSYIVPYEKNGTKYYKMSFALLIFHRNVLFYYFDEDIK